MIVQTGPIALTSWPSASRRSQATLDGLGHGDRLRHGEGDGGVDADPAVGGLLHRADAGLGGRDLHDDVGRQRVELDRLGDERVGIAVEPRVGLHREPAVAPAVLGEGVGQQRGGLDRELLHHRPADLGLRRGGVLGGVLPDPLLPPGQVAAQGGQGDHRVAGGTHRTPADRGRQLGRGGRVVPQPGRGLARHAQQGGGARALAPVGRLVTPSLSFLLEIHELSARCAVRAPCRQRLVSRSVVRPGRRVTGRLRGLVAARVRGIGPEETAEGLVDVVDRRISLKPRFPPSLTICTT